MIITGRVEVRVKSNGNNKWIAEIKGIKKGEVIGFFKIGNEGSEPISITVKELDLSDDSGSNSEDDSSGTGTSSGENGGSSGTTSTSEPEGEVLDLNIMDENFPNQFDPNEQGGESISYPIIRIIIPIVNTILSLIQVFGAIIMVLCLAIAGFNGIVAVHEGVAEDLGLSLGKNTNEYGITMNGVVKPLNKGALTKIIRRGLIGSFFLFASATIVKVVCKLISGL